MTNQEHLDILKQGVDTWNQWRQEHPDIQPDLRPRIDDAIRIHDKLLLVLSENSVNSTWVEKEVETAFEEERQRNKLILFPIRLDDTAMTTTQAWAADIRRIRHIGDFRNWKNRDDYQRRSSDCSVISRQNPKLVGEEF